MMQYCRGMLRTQENNMLQVERTAVARMAPDMQRYSQKKRGNDIGKENEGCVDVQVFHFHERSACLLAGYLAMPQPLKVSVLPKADARCVLVTHTDTWSKESS
jgi:hypothetical protein